MLNSPLVTDLIRLALREDMPSGDITSELTVPADSSSRAEVYAKQSLVVCGLPLIHQIFEVSGVKAEIKLVKSDGDLVGPKDVIASIESETRALLSLERTVLNFLQRLSGIATLTRSVVEKAQGFSVCDTRKTTPGWRVLEKYAVRIGGGRNHRGSLSDMVLVKNNHIDAMNGDIKATLTRVFKEKPAYVPVEVEVRAEAELRAVAEFNPDIIMLDNMQGADLKSAVELARKIAPKSKLEVSGGVTEARFPEFESLKIDFVSMGALTHSARSVDISMRILKA